MELTYDLLVILHLLGMASLVGGWLVQMRSRGDRMISPAMLHGAIVQVVSGLALVGIGESALDRDYDSAKLAVKTLIAVVILVLALANRRKPPIPVGLYLLIGALALGNVTIAVLWS